MQCNKTGLTLEDWKTILDVVNVYDPNDIAHVYPEMGSPEFMQDVSSVFKKVHQIVLRHPDNQPNIGNPFSENILAQEELDSIGEDK